MNYSLLSLKRIIGDYIGDYYRGYKGDTKISDHGSYGSAQSFQKHVVFLRGS